MSEEKCSTCGRVLAVLPVGRNEFAEIYCEHCKTTRYVELASWQDVDEGDVRLQRLLSS
jgi:predicted nucleic-acid-binding Zn-ribbon protein